MYVVSNSQHDGWIWLYVVRWDERFQSHTQESIADLSFGWVGSHQRDHNNEKI